MNGERENSGKRRGCGFGCALLIGLFIGLGALVAMLIAGGLGVSATTPGSGVSAWFRRPSAAGEDDAPFMHEIWASGQGTVKVARIPLSGMILLNEMVWPAGNANTVLRSIRRATHDPDVRGLLIEINSGGGGITDSDVIYQALLDFKAAGEGRVVVALLGDVAASGAYYVALAADHIIAHPTTLTGSIGVLLQSYNIQELARKVGLQDVTIKSGEHKDLLNPFQEVRPEQREMLQQVINAMHAHFLSLVVERRGLSADVASTLAQGQVFIAAEALRHRLIDGIGYQDDAQRRLAELLDVQDVRVYRYAEQVSLMDLLTRPGIGMRADWLSWLRQSVGEARLLYYWSW